MAKVNSLITLNGTYGGITFVKSAKYGDHIRAPRGTHKKAVLNPAWKRQSKRTLRANGPAQIFQNAIRPYHKDFYDGSMWSRFLSHVLQHLGDEQSFDFSTLKPFEIHKGYPLHRFFNLQTNTRVAADRSVLDVEVSYDTHPIFDKSLSIDGYQLQIIGIFPDQKKKSAHTGMVSSVIIRLQGNTEPLKMQIPLPPKAKTFLVCVRIDGCAKGKPYGALAAKGMKMVEAGKI